MTNTADLQTILRRVRAMIDRADHPLTGAAEAATYRAKAEEMMQEYRIAEEDLMATDVGVKIEPIDLAVDMGVQDSNPYLSHLWAIMDLIARHSGCRLANTWSYDGEGGYHLVAHLVGYEVDSRFADLLFTSARLVWSRRIDPVVDPTLSDAENIYFLRSSGLSRAAVANMVWGSGMKDGSAHGRVQAIYLRECQRRGETPQLTGRNVSAKTYREVFADQFVSTFSARLRAARDGADKAVGTMELHGRAERVEEKFYELYPQYRPGTAVATADSGKPARTRKCTKADETRYQRKYLSPAALAGRAAGRAAAEEVSLTGTERVQRIGTDAAVVDSSCETVYELGR